MRRLFDFMIERQNGLGALLSREHKPVAEAKAEIAYGAGFIEWFAEEGDRLHGMSWREGEHAQPSLAMFGNKLRDQT